MISAPWITEETYTHQSVYMVRTLYIFVCIKLCIFSYFSLALCFPCSRLTHWGRVTHICVSKLTIIGSDNGLSPVRRQAIIWTNAGILLIGPLGTNFSEIIIEIYIFSFRKMHIKMLSGKWRPSCLGLSVLTQFIHSTPTSVHIHEILRPCPQAQVVEKIWTLCDSERYVHH